MIIKMTDEQRKNLMVFLNRAELKGSEVGAFVELANAINRAQPEEEPNADDVSGDNQ